MQDRLDDREEGAVVAVLDVLHQAGDRVDIGAHIAEDVEDGLLVAGSLSDIVAPVIEAGFDLVRRVVVRIRKVEERVEIEGVRFASHIGDGGGLVSLFRRTPEEEVGIVVGHIVGVETVVQQFAVRHRLVVRQVAAYTEAFVIALFAESFVGEKVQACRDVEIADAPCVRHVEPFIQRVADAGKYAFAQERLDVVFPVPPESFVAPLVVFIRRVAIHADVGAEAGGRCQIGPFGPDVDHAVQR